ncbi:GNAT family N-acetyltransferase [Actinomadura craniellae]|uniref:GNAT family N-acetyltransferase n=1 Tax=Actinomadura craniellae TaxID=2231787 RepID=A0A365HCM1_9ACTN|nr:GNAT family N-acetyltransferase [Actinomadura craniellae]RAY16837.1 GNAT family N-acetyltransferase [Actinomadura craniellae]
MDRSPGLELRSWHGHAVLEVADTLTGLYRAAFCAPPWNEPPVRAVMFRGRLVTDAERPGFVAVTACREGVPVGFGTAWTTRSPFPTDRRYPDITARLGAERVTTWLIGSQEIDELAVSPGAQGLGVGTALLETLTAFAGRAGSWLLTSTASPHTVPFYRACGWHQITRITAHPSLAVFLSPAHPAGPARTGGTR